MAWWFGVWLAALGASGWAGDVAEGSPLPLALGMDARIPAETRVVLIGDTGEPDDARCGRGAICPRERERLLDGIAARQPDAVLALGDLFYGKNGERPEVTERMRSTYSGIAGITWPLAGNHEGYGDLSDAARAQLPEIWREVFPAMESVELDHLSYTLRLGIRSPVCVKVANSADAFLGKLVFPDGPWGEACRWRVLASHHMWTTTYEKDDGQHQIRDAVAEHSEAWGAPPDVVAAAHAHHQEAEVVDGVLGIVSGAGSKVRCPEARRAELANGRTKRIRCRRGGEVEGELHPERRPIWLSARLGYTVVDFGVDEVRLERVELSRRREFRRCWTLGEDRVAERVRCVRDRQVRTTVPSFVWGEEPTT